MPSASRIHRLSAGPETSRPEGSGPEPPSTLPHVLLVVDGFPKALGGGERVVLRLAELLPRFGYRVSILTFRVDPESPVLRSEAPCPLYLLALRRTYDWESVRCGMEFGRFVKAERIGLVMTFFESSDLWTGAYTRLLSGAKLVWNRRDLGILRDQKHRLAYRLLARAPHRVFCVSDRVSRYTVTEDHVPASRVETVYNGLDLRRFAPVKRSPAPAASPMPTASPAPAAWSAPAASPGAEGWHIVTVGNLRRVKGHDVLLRAAAEVLKQFPATHFSFAGDVLEPEYAAELHTLARALGIEQRVRFPGGVTDLPAFLATADVFVLPSRSEGFSNAILEAMASGLPVVATDVGGNAEAVQHGDTGLIVPPEDAPNLAAAILSLLTAPETARTMGARGRLRAAERFSEDAVLSQIAAAWDRLLGRSPHLNAESS